MRTSKTTICCTLVLAVVLGISAANAQTVIEVKDHVLKGAAEFEPLGFNFAGNTGALGYANGNLVVDSGFEPGRMRELYRVIESGADNGRRWITLDGAGTSNWQQYGSGLFSGATMRAYRFVDANGRPLPYREYKFARTSGQVLDVSQGEALAPLFVTRVIPRGTDGFPAGGWLAETPEIEVYRAMSAEEKEIFAKQWRVYYESDVALRMDDVVIFERGDFYEFDPQDFHPRLKVDPDGDSYQRLSGSAKRIPVPQDVPEEMDAGRAVLEMTPEDGRAEIGRTSFSGTASSSTDWYGLLEAGVRYRFEVWAREVDGTSGTVLLGMGPVRTGKLADGYFGDKSTVKQFPAPGQWQRIGFEFIAPETPADGALEGYGIVYEGQGRLMVDNLKLQPVYEEGDADKPFVVNHRLLEAMLSNQPADGRKGAQRGRFGMNSISMATLCDWNPECDVTIGAGGPRFSPFAKQITPGLPQSLTILEATGDSPETRMVPWLVGQVTHCEDEYRQLVEYLCAPYDPAVDSPETKPMAYKRYRQRGHGRPWSKDFREIIIQFGNENWHNRRIALWIGFGRAGWVHQGGREFGLWAKYMIGEIQKSPYYDGEVLKTYLDGNSISGVKDGVPTGYGFEATVAAEGTNSYMGPTNYIGPRWEYNEQGQSVIDDQGVQKTLLSYRTDRYEELESQHQAAEAMRAMGITTKLAIYEAGPSGFVFDRTKSDLMETSEYYGKTKAIATAMLDAWFDAWRLGFTHQCYHSFRQGKMWSSHTSYHDGFRPAPGWLSQTLINRQMVNADLVDVAVRQSPVARIEIAPPPWKRDAEPTQKEIGLIQAHATIRPGRIAVAVVNLDLHQQHPVEIALPVRTARSITRHFLSGDPRDTNQENLKVAIAVETIPLAALAKGRLTAQLEPGSLQIYVFETRPHSR